MLNEAVRQHLRKYWQVSRTFFLQGESALAAFFAITLVEEVGKVIILGNRDLSNELDRRSFFNHEAKYSYAVYSTLLVNSRVSRVYEADEARFAAWFREGQLFSIRNQALYLDLNGTDVVTPQNAVARGDAYLLVCISGEVLAEIQGAYTGGGVADWEQMLSEVDSFRRAANVPVGPA